MLFQSLSEEYRERLCAILLCGHGSDGTSCLRTLKANGSKIIIQRPDECSAKALPINAINTGCFDKVFSINETVDYLTGRIWQYSFNEEEAKQFLSEIHDVYGYDFRGYRIESIIRRIKVAQIKLNLAGFAEFRQAVLTDPDLFEELFLEFSINVTEFFRDPAAYEGIRNKVLPQFYGSPYLKIWCAGCSTGEEPYSLAMLLDELGMLEKSQIYATDINPYVIQEAKNGLFPVEKVQKSAANYKLSGGIKDKLEDYFEIKGRIAKIDQKLKEKILFFEHSLGGRGVFNEFQLIMCRNVIIYFNPELQQDVLTLFEKSLDPSGFLILGQGEAIIGRASRVDFQVFDKQNRIFKKA